MIELDPDGGGFKTPLQREVLAGLCRNAEISERFFLTGGTALAAFYLGHRISEDLDMFSREQRELGDIDFWIAKAWPGKTVPIRRSSGYLSVLIRDIKVDIVCDPLAMPGARKRAKIGENLTIAVDTIDNIASNKLTTIVSRTEPKDFIDLYCILRRYPRLDMPGLYSAARIKDVQFDDPASVAYQIELGIEEMRRIVGAGPDTAEAKRLPPLLVSIDWEDFWRVFSGITEWIYAQGGVRS